MTAAQSEIGRTASALVPQRRSTDPSPTAVATTSVDLEGGSLSTELADPGRGWQSANPLLIHGAKDSGRTTSQKTGIG
jgi:hypothetical protein